MGVGTRGEPHLAVGAERELEAPPPPSAAAEAEGFGDIISPESPGAGTWSDSPVQVGLLMDSRCEVVRFGVTATARDRPRVRCCARDGDSDSVFLMG